MRSQHLSKMCIVHRSTLFHYMSMCVCVWFGKCKICMSRRCHYMQVHANERIKNEKWVSAQTEGKSEPTDECILHIAFTNRKLKKLKKNNNNETTTTTKQKKMSIEKKNSFNLNWKGGNAETHIRRQLFLLLGPLGRSPSHFSSLNATVLRSASMHEMMKRRALDAQLHLFIFFGIIRPAICMCRQYSAQRAEHNQDLVCWNRLHAMHTAHWCETRKCAQLGTKYVRMWMDGDDELKKNKHSFVHSIWIYTCTHSVRMWVCARRHCSVNIFIASQRNDVTHFTKLPNLFSYFAHTATHANCIFFAVARIASSRGTRRMQLLINPQCCLF